MPRDGERRRELTYSIAERRGTSCPYRPSASPRDRRASATLNGALLRVGLVDELLVYVAAKLLGEGAGLAAIGLLTRLDQGVELTFSAASMVGADLRVLLSPRI